VAAAAKKTRLDEQHFVSEPAFELGLTAIAAEVLELAYATSRFQP
jgi:hypothetical protein